jgi:hypothetical protein
MFELGIVSRVAIEVESMSVPVTEGTEEDGDGVRTQRHCAALDGGIRDPRQLFALHFLVEEDDDGVEKLGTMGGHVVSEPFVQVQILSAGC